MSATINIGEWSFDHVDYDVESDVLYLSIGAPRKGYGETTPEGHVARFDDEGNFMGLTLVSIKALLEQGGTIAVTLPKPPAAEEVNRTNFRQVLELA